MCMSFTIKVGTHKLQLITCTPLHHMHAEQCLIVAIDDSIVQETSLTFKPQYFWTLLSQLRISNLKNPGK